MNDYDYKTTAQKVWTFARPVLIYAISIAIVCSIVLFGYNFVMKAFVLPVDKTDPTPVVIEVKSGSSSTSIANLLYGDGDDETNRLIRNKAAFKIYVDFTGKGSKLKAGTYTFDRTMGIPSIVRQLEKGDGRQKKAIKFTLTEGMTADDMAHSLVNQKVLTSPDRFLELAKTASAFKFELPEDSKTRKYALDGYLFPDTYEVFEGSSEETIISKMLARFNDVFTAEYIQRANELNMTTDQVVTLASMIEREAKTGDFKKVSAVFHNRLKDEMLLQSCATLQYALDTRNYVLSKTQLENGTPYNTYKFPGLPVGPIANPGKKAIEAALYPDEEYVKEKYMYFCLKEPESGELAFSKTLKEHDATVAKYKDQWLAYDASRES